MNTILLAMIVSSAVSQSNNMSLRTDGRQVAVMCMKSGEQTSGMNKICYYDCLGSTKATNVRSYELCPMTIND